MGAVDQDGSITPAEEQEEKTAADVLAEQPEIYDPYSNATALDEVRDKTIINHLKGFLSGTPIIVNWYHQITSNATTSSGTTTPSFMSDSVNTSFLRIDRMEIKLDAPMEYNFDEELSQSKLSGVCLTYPGFTPKIGDLFLYQISPGKIGLFKVAKNPERRTLHNATAHMVTFEMLKMLTTSDYQAMEERVRQRGIFDKQRFLNEDGALITHQEAQDLEYLTDKIDDLIHIFGRRYYNTEYRTFLIDETLYDPYVTKFYRELCGSYWDNHFVELPQSMGILDNWDRSLFATLLGQNPWGTPMLTCKHEPVSYDKWSSLFTMLHGKSFVMLTDTVDEEAGEELVDYVSESIFSNNANTQDDFDKLVTLFLDQDTLSTTLLKQAIENVTQLDSEHGFYQILILVFFAKVVINTIHTGKATEIVNRVVEPYIHIPFTQDDLDTETNTVTINTLLNKAIALLDDQDELINISDSLVTYDDSTLTVDLSSIMATLEITEIPGTWHIVVSNHLLIDPPEE